ncbi:unannotated protein [freshwater metagenome]|uniref:Unannotated protein n=1 Tax=freshwater metagenome TaxID=449393 RepID=A0A6J7F153_9ZZZZ|nr:hypothetical protein [Actinomycetota bacterium]
MLILVRHGRTAANAGGLLQGRSDLPLDEVGQEQVRKVAEAIGRVDLVISSSLARARATAAAFDAPHNIDDRWIELDFGVYDGMALSVVPAEAWSQWRSDASYAPPQGETMATLDERVRSACSEVFELARSQTVVVVSHVSPIKAAVAWALGGDITMSWRIHLDQAAVCRISCDASRPVVRSVNEVLYR